MKNSEIIQGVEVFLSTPVDGEFEWVHQREPYKQLMACWMKVSEKDLPLSPRVVGSPGLGKTTMAMAAALEMKQELYLMQCTSDTRPEDLIITPVLNAEGKISYHASPLLTAVIRGGIVILDEGNRMSEKSWASLAGLLDHRRTVESVIAGITIKAHPEFRCAVTMNEDNSTFDIPDYILSRIQPAIEIPFPSRKEELEILKYNLPDSEEELLLICTEFLQRAHGLELPYSLRDGINAVRYALKLHKQNEEQDFKVLFDQAIQQILGKEALDMEALAEKRKKMFGDLPNLELGDFFFDEGDDDLNPDNYPGDYDPDQ